MIKRASHIDIYVFISVIGLMMFSIGAVYSASIAVSDIKHGDYSFLFRSHALKVVIGIIALFVAMLIDYHVYKKLSKILLVVAIILLAYTIFNGVSIKGAQRWISLGPIQFQPSEFAKYALVIHISVLLALKQEYVRDFKYGFIPLMIWIVAVVVLVLIQPNFSTGAIILLICMLLLFVGRVKIQHMAATTIAGLPLLVIYAISAPYRWSRIMAFIPGAHSDYSSADAAKWQTNQAIIGMGCGGIFGVGMGLSKQRELFLPESYTDFIFAIIGEEYGLIGSVLILAVFAVIMIRGMKIAKHAADDLGRYLALGVTITITVYALINAMVTTGMLPTTGLPMPLISYGGTSIIFTAYSLGILINVSKYTRLRPLQTSEADGGTAPIAGEVF